MDLVQRASKLGYNHYTEFTVDDLDKLPLDNSNKQIEYFFIQKWLREEHNIDITVMIRFASSYGVIIHKNRNTPNNFKEIIIDTTPENHIKGVYEDALEKALQEALKLI